MNVWDYSIFWKETISQLKSELTEQEFSMWFNMSYEFSDESSITISVPSTFYRDQVKVRYQKKIEDKIFEISGLNIVLKYQIKANPKAQENIINSNSKPQATESTKIHKTSSIEKKEVERAPHSQLRQDYSFENFVIGENTSLAANAAIAIAKNPGHAYNPFLIYGGVGLGKTHLMQAIGNLAWKEKGCKIIYITAESFTNEFVDAILKSKTQEFKNKYRNADMLLIDDIHFLQKKNETQEELFHTFNALYDANKQIIFTCDRPVSELKNLSDRLKSRFERGLNVDLQPPSYETRCAILSKKIEKRGIQIPQDVIDLVAKNISSNVRDLEASLTKLIAYAELTGKAVTLEVAQQQLRDSFGSPKQKNVSIEIIQKIVAEYFSLSYADLKSKKRTKTITFPRHIAMFLSREITEYSLTEIGIDFGGRDHTTVMHGIQKIEERLKAEPSLETTLQELNKRIKDYNS